MRDYWGVFSTKPLTGSYGERVKWLDARKAVAESAPHNFKWSGYLTEDAANSALASLPEHLRPFYKVSVHSCL